MMEIEKANLLGLPPPQNAGDDNKTQTPKERMQQFIQITSDNCYHILGSAGPALGRDFFQIPQIALALVTHVFTNLDVSSAIFFSINLSSLKIVTTQTWCRYYSIS